MAEQAREKKKLAIARRILKSIGLGVLVLLLILAVIFQAPWKLTALLLVVLLACTVLPKPARKWFWITGGVLVTALILWIFLPERGQWLPYTFDEELAALEAERAIPVEQNAATIYTQLLDSHDANSLYPDSWDPNLHYSIVSEPWSSEDYPELAQWLRGHQNTIEQLLQASQKEQCRFPIHADPVGFAKTMERFAPMRAWAQLLVYSGNNDFAEGRIDRAVEKYLTTLQMAEHLYQQPTLIELLVGIAVEALATKHCRRLVVTGDATEEHLNLIEETLGGITLDWSSDLPKILECERLMTKNMLCSMIYEVNPKGKTRLSRDPAAMMRAQFPDKVPPPTYWQSKLTKAGIVLGWFFMPSTPQKAGEIIDASYEELYAMAESDFDWQKATQKPSRMLQFNYRYLVEHLAGISEPAYHRIHDTYLRNTAEKRGSRLIIALRRYKNKHGHWPESLNGIESLAPAEIFVDPINDNSFVYKLTDENFTLYSKGKNTIDENGQYNSTWDPNSFEDRVEEDDILIWPRRSRKTKEGNADAQ